MLDLADYDITRAETGETMVLKYPGTDIEMKQDDGTPITLTLAGTDSLRYRKVRRELVKARQEASKRNKDQVPIELIENESVDIVAGCLVGWQGIILDGETLECTPHNARRLLQRCPWAMEQAELFLHDRKNFLNGYPNGLSP